MDVVLYPSGIIEAAHPGQGIMDIADAGFTKMVLDLSMYCRACKLEQIGNTCPAHGAQHGPGVEMMEHLENLNEYLGLITDKCADAVLEFPVGAAPYLPRDTKYMDLNGLLLRLAEESIKVCGKAGCRFLIVRPLSAGVTDSELWDVNRGFYLRLAARAREYSMMILLENQCGDIGGHLVRGVCSDGGRAVQWVDRLNEEAGRTCFGFCMDVGVCNLCGQNMYDFCIALGDRLKAVVLRDCDGIRENAMLPFTCVDRGRSRTDWLNLIRGLRRIRFNGRLILNMEDTAAAFSPILRPALLQLAKSSADYMGWQIELEEMLDRYPIRVLFGAGNMCRNYMKCYGEQYPPLYTCDNNKALWGTVFCGLEVKPPESLRNLPPGCAVFICNIYYREIERQLRDMGITARIEYFNDEYMPAFYFDRLEQYPDVFRRGEKDKDASDRRAD